MSEYLWTGSAGDGDFGNGNNWIDTTNSLPGEPGTSDVAVLETKGTIIGNGSVGGLDIISSGGALSTQTLSLNANSLALSGSVTLGSGTSIGVTDDVALVGTSTIVENNGSALRIYGNDGTSGDVVTAINFAQNSSDKVTYTITGLGTLLEAFDGNTIIGGAGISSVTVSNGGTLQGDNQNNDGSGNITLGGAAGAQGTLTVTGTYSTLELAATLNVGSAGKGIFTLSAGADAELGQNFSASFGSTAMVVGVSAGSTGTVTVSGAGTRLGSNVYGTVTVGSAGTGTMTVSAGASANFGLLEVGGSNTGSVTVTGVGSVLQLHEAALIGVGAKGIFQILAGAHLGMVGNSSDTLTLGSQSGSNGTLTVSGAGSVVSADNDQVQIGYSGTGTATLSSGGVIKSGAPTSSGSHTAALIGTESGSVGTAMIENPNSVWTAKGEFDVGYLGTGTLLVETGGVVSSGNYNGVAGFVEGNLAGSSGTVTVTGTGSKITNNGRFVVASSGSGTLNISAGATVTTALPSGSKIDGAVIGALSGGSGHVTVGGTGAAWTIGSDLVVGAAGTGALHLTAGGTVSAANLLEAGSGTSYITIAGAGAKLAISGNALFGNPAKASVSIATGGVLSIGGTGELKNGSIALTGGSLTDANMLTVDAAQTISGYGSVQTAGLINAGTVQATGGTLSFIGGVTGTGKFNIAANSTLSLGSAVGTGQQAIFQSATSKLVLGAPASFAGTISTFIKGDTIDLSGVVGTSLTYSGQTLTVHESGGASLALKFAGTYTQASFAAPTSDGHGGTLISHT